MKTPLTNLILFLFVFHPLKVWLLMRNTSLKWVQTLRKWLQWTNFKDWKRMRWVKFIGLTWCTDWESNTKCGILNVLNSDLAVENCRTHSMLFQTWSSLMIWEQKELFSKISILKESKKIRLNRWLYLTGCFLN